MNVFCITITLHHYASLSLNTGNSLQTLTHDLLWPQTFRGKETVDVNLFLCHLSTEGLLRSLDIPSSKTKALTSQPNLTL